KGELVSVAEGGRAGADEVGGLFHRRVRWGLATFEQSEAGQGGVADLIGATIPGAVAKLTVAQVLDAAVDGLVDALLFFRRQARRARTDLDRLGGRGRRGFDLWGRSPLLSLRRWLPRRGWLHGHDRQGRYGSASVASRGCQGLVHLPRESRIFRNRRRLHVW